MTRRTPSRTSVRDRRPDGWPPWRPRLGRRSGSSPGSTKPRRSGASRPTSTRCLTRHPRRFRSTGWRGRPRARLGPR
jgi:hypothetical protein